VIHVQLWYFTTKKKREAKKEKMKTSAFTFIPYIFFVFNITAGSVTNVGSISFAFNVIIRHFKYTLTKLKRKKIIFKYTL
jgi:hypothetical protein